MDNPQGVSKSGTGSPLRLPQTEQDDGAEMRGRRRHGLGLLEQLGRA